jgi:APA family basic amino acid/polyamine antiporter
MIGAGIFITPGLVAGHLNGVLWPLIGWTLGGLLALGGASVYGELGSRLPKAGGDYQYLATAFGPLWGFLFGWAAITLSFSAAAAAMARVAVEYFAGTFRAVGAFAPDARPVSSDLLKTVAAPLIVLALTLANTVGARVAGRTTALLTAIPVTGLIVLAVVGAVTVRGDVRWPTGEPIPDRNWLLAFGAAMVPIFYTYSGWNAAAYVAGEIREPGRNLARSLLIGAGLVTAAYIVFNLSLILTVPHSELAGSTTAVADVIRRQTGKAGAAALSTIIGAAILGSANVTLMAGARIYYAMAVDGLAPRAFARINRAGVPAVALWAGGLWAAVLSVVTDVGRLVGWATLAILLLSSLTAVSLFVFRRRGHIGTTYRCAGYPVTPVVYLVACLGVAAVSAVNSPVESLVGLGMVALGVVVYPFARRWFGERK